MIDLQRLNGHRLLLNPDLIRQAEPTPDLTLTLVTGEKLVVAGTCENLITLITQYRASVLKQAWPEAAQTLNALAAVNATKERL